MIISSHEDVTPAVLDAYKKIEDPRLREIVTALVKHLHAFAREVHLTEEEFQKGTEIIARLGQLTNATHNEVVLMAGSLGLSSLVCLLNNGNNGQTETTANLLGPFWRMNSPRTENGASIIRSPTPGPALFVNCWLKQQNGKPIEGAEIERFYPRDGDRYEGPTIIRCARLRAIAHGGQSLLSQATGDLVIDHMPAGAWLDDMGVHRLKDIERPERVHQLRHPDPGRHPRFSPAELL
jgi:hypothetical protein